MQATHAELKANFLDYLPTAALPLLQPMHYAMIDELIEHCLNGTSTLNDRVPATIDEYNTLIGYGLMSLIPAFDGMISGVRAANPNEEVDIIVNYRDQQFKIKEKRRVQ